MQRRAVWMGIAVGIAAIVAVLIVRSSTVKTGSHSGSVAGRVPAEEAPRPVRETREERARPGHGDISEARRHRDEVLRAILAARSQRLSRTAGANATSPGGASGPADPDVGTLDKEYIRDRIVELKPLLVECYELAQADEPELEGKLVVQFVIGGEPDVGGVVEESEIDPSSSLKMKSATLEECVRETMYAADFKAPSGGGRVTVRYPFIFTPDP